MKRPNPIRSQLGGLSMIEVLVTCAVLGITGAVMFNLLYTGMVLFAKNSAINIAHQEARAALMQMEQDLHAAVSIPELVNTTGAVVSGAGPAAGIQFELWGAGPYQITPNASGYATTQNQVKINIPSGGVVPVANQRLIIPMFQTELNITAVANNGSTATLTLASNLPFAINTTQGSPAATVNIACFVTDYVSYCVIGTQLIYYPRQSLNGSPQTIANDLTSATPFSIPATPLGAPYYRFVAAINLVTTDTSYGNLRFRAANMFLNAMEPYRARLCVYQ